VTSRSADDIEFAPAMPVVESPETTWTPRSLIDLASSPPEPPTIGGLLYPSKRTLLSGETESLKTWLALILVKAEIDAGFPVAWVDVDAMGSGELLARLRALGVHDAQIDEMFAYYEPAERLAGGALIDVSQHVAAQGVRLFVIDAFNPMLGLHGLDPNSTPDIETFWREVATPITESGAAPVLLDHVVKNSEGRGKYAYGSERKASGAIVHIGFRPIEAFSRGGTGRTLLQTHKDRPGFLPRPVIGKLVLDSNGDTVSYRLEADRSRATGEWWPTFLMERVSEWLAKQDEPVPRREIADSVPGKDERIKTAIDVLVEEGFARQTDGPRGAKMVGFVRYFREAEYASQVDDSTSSRALPVLFPRLESDPSPATSSLFPPLRGREEPRKRSQAVPESSSSSLPGLNGSAAQLDLGRASLADIRRQHEEGLV
jgi:hypothetical protein